MMPKLSLVIPVFNGSEYLPKTILTVGEWSSGQTDAVEVIFVNDGSTDTTNKILESINTRFKVVNLPNNLGKGAALREGFKVATGQLVAFTDADLPYGLVILEKMVAEFNAKPSLKFLYGSRSHAASQVKAGYGFARQFGRWFFSHAAHLVVRSDIKDTQCGVKMFRADLAQALVKLTKLNRFAFDIELFVVASQNKFLAEPFPVELSHRRESSVHIVVDTARMLLDIFQIRVRLIGGGYRLNQ